MYVLVRAREITANNYIHLVLVLMALLANVIDVAEYCTYHRKEEILISTYSHNSMS